MGLRLSISALMVPLRPGAVRFLAIWLAIPVLFLGNALRTDAQTAHGQGMIRILVGVPYTDLGGIAVDPSGDLFFDGAGILGELVAVNGTIPSNATVRDLALLGGSGYGLIAPLAFDVSGDLFAGGVVPYGPTGVLEVPAVNGVIPDYQAATLLVSNVPNPLNNVVSLTSLALDKSGDLFILNTAGTLYEARAVSGVVPVNPTLTPIATPASFDSGIVVDAAGDIFSADAYNNVEEIVAVDGSIPANPTILTWGGLSPNSVAVDPSGNLFVSTVNNIKELLAVNGAVPPNPSIITWPSDPYGPWYFVAFGGLATDAAGDVFISGPCCNDSPGSNVYEIEPRSGDFGVEDVGSASAIALVTFAFDSPGVLGGWNVLSAQQAAGAGHDFAEVPANDTCAAGGSYQAGDTCYVALRFTPQQPGQRTGAVQLLDAGGNIIATTPLKGVGQGPPLLVVESQASDFGTETVGGTSATALVTFTFDSAGTLSGWSVLPNQKGANPALDFAEVPATDTCSTSQSYNPGDTCSIGVQFSPQRPGLRTGAVQLLDTDGNVIGTAPLKGIGEGPQIVYPSNTAATSIFDGGANLFWQPSVAVDAAGDAYVPSGNMIEEILAMNGSIPPNPTTRTFFTDGFITAVATDAAGDVYYFSDGAIGEIEAVNGVVPSNPTIRVLATGFDQLYGASGLIAVDASGNIVEAESGDCVVKELEAFNGTVPTSPTIRVLPAAFAEPVGVAVDSAGDVFVADYRETVSLVKEIVAVDGAIPANPAVLTVGGGFNNPFGVAVDAAGDVFVGDQSNNEVKEVLSATDTILSIGGGFDQPLGVAVDAAGNLLVADANVNSGSVRVIPLASAPSLTFPTATAAGATDSTDGPMSITIANNGNAPLVFPLPGGIGTAVSPRIIGTNTTNPVVSSNFLWDPSSTCEQTTSSSPAPFSLAPGASCTIVIDFAPAAGSAGTVSGSVTLTDDNENVIGATQTIPLSGTAVLPAPVAGLTATGLTFSGEDVGSPSQPQAIQVNNTGTGPLVVGGIAIVGTNPGDFSETDNCGFPVAVGAFCTINVTFKPTATGARSATLTVTDNSNNVSGSTQSASLSGTGLAPQTSYDVASSFEQGWASQSNPNGVWSYGYSSGFTAPVTLYTSTAQPGVNGPDAQYWAAPLSYAWSPTAEFNDGPAYDDGNIDFLADEFVLVAGINGQYSDLVFTAPATGTYSVASSFRGDQYGIGTLVSVVVNGTVAFNAAVTAEGQVLPFDTVVNLTSGQTIVFSVGPGGGLQNTGLSATITTGAVPVATPTFSPAAGTYNAVQQVSILDGDTGATIYYTTDGTTPTIHSAVFNSGSPISVSANTTIKAIAVESGLKNSAVATANYVLKVLEPTIGLAAGTYSTTQQAAITDGTSNAAIWYTTDGMTPVPGASDATLYGGSPVQINQSTELKAVAAVSGWTTSTAASAKYTLKVAEPLIGLTAGSYSTPQQASISDSNGSATIWYTTDGMTPVPGASDATQYVSGNPVEISQSATLKAVAAISGWTTSTAASAKYTLKVPEPVISLATGSYSTAQQAAISDSNAGATIWYTTDGMTPVPGAGDATLYVSGNPVQIDQTTTLKAVAAVTGWTTSVPASASYTFKVPTPTFSLAAGTYSSPQSTTISDTDAGATIWYTTDGSTPAPGGAMSTQYAGGPIAINSTTKLKAVAAESGWTTSAAAAASYTIK